MTERGGPPAGNLTREYPPEIMARWRGCINLDCIAECNITEHHCGRLAEFARICNGEEAKR